MSEADLNEMLSFDGLELLLMTVGQFFASGALWLFLDKYMDAEFAWTGLTGFCAASFVFGIVMIVAAFIMRSVKRDKVKRLFDNSGS